MIPELQKLNPAVVKSARGKGLMNAIEIHATDGGFLEKLISVVRFLMMLLFLKCTFCHVLPGNCLTGKSI